MARSGVKAWVDQLTKHDMPVLGSVVAELNSITGNEESDVNQLAEVILRDPNLTSHVLRVANSVRYNYSKTKVNTVSRAIVMIGLKGMRAICISLLLLDSLVSDTPKERMVHLIAQGFHAATQAKNLLDGGDNTDQEEVFIAALLFNLGEMAFWSSQDISRTNEGLLHDDPKLRRKAMENVLGTSFKAITLELARHWKLGETLEQSLFPNNDVSGKVKAVIIGERLSRAALYGWDSAQVKKVLSEVAEYRGIDLEQALDEVKRGADEAAQAAVNYGVAEACPMIPCSSKNKIVPVRRRDSRVLKPDTELQLNILRELTCAASEKTDVNTIFQMVLEGMHRGIALERVAVAFIEGRKLKLKYALGEHTEHWRSGFLFDVGPYAESIFTQALESPNHSSWFDDKTIADNDDLYPQDVVQTLGKLPSFVFVLHINQRKAAVFYADRWTYGGKLSSPQYESFKHFANQAQISLNLLSKVL